MGSYRGRGMFAAEVCALHVGGRCSSGGLQAEQILKRSSSINTGTGTINSPAALVAPVE